MSKYDEMRKELKYSIIDLDADHYNLSKFMQVIDEIFIKYRGNIEQPKIGGWIPCSERLPDKDGEYICTQKIYNLSNGKLSGKSVELVEFYNGKWRRAKHLKVIAWQPLPEEYHE